MTNTAEILKIVCAISRGQDLMVIVTGVMVTLIVFLAVSEMRRGK